MQQGSVTGTVFRRYRRVAELAVVAMLAACGGPRAVMPTPVVVGVGDVPPIVYWDTGGRPAGFAVEVLKEAARREGIQLSWRWAGTSSEIDRDLTNGALDLLPAAVDTQERRGRFFVSKPWWFAELELIGRDGLTLARLNGKRLSLASPSFRGLAARYFPGTIVIPPGAQWRGGRSALAEVCSGAADAALVSHLDLHAFALNAPAGCEGTPLRMLETDALMDLSVIARLAKKDVAERLRHRIDELTVDGTLAAVASRNPPVTMRSAGLLANVIRNRYRYESLSISLAAALVVMAGLVIFFLRQERTRRVLERSEARYQSLFDLAATGIVHVDAATRKFAAVNQEFCKIVGYTREEILSAGIGFMDLTVADDQALSRDSYEQLVTGEVRSYAIEKRYRRKDGDIIWVRVDCAGVRSGGRLLYAVAVIQDITERRETEQALRESEDRLRLAMDSTQLGTFDYNPQTGALVWSDYAKRHFGLPPEAEVDYQILLKGLHPEDRPMMEKLAGGALRGENGGRYTVEHRSIGIEDGKERWISVSGRVFFDGQGRPERLIGVTLDITERKRAEQALRRALAEASAGRRLLDAMLEHVPLGIAIADAPDFKIRKMSRYGLRLIGKTAEEVTGAAAGRNPAESRMYGPGESAPAPEEELPLSRATRRGEVVTEEEWVFVREDGTKVPVLCSAAPILDSEGRITGAVSGWYDITRRKQTEQALRDSERHFRELADSMPQLVWRAGCDGAVTYHNRQWQTQLGVAEGEPLGERWTDLVHPEDRQACLESWRRSVEAGELWRSEYRLRTEDGSYRWFLGRAVPVRDGEGRIQHWFGTWTDIDEGKCAEERLRQTQKLESVGLLAGGIAHDFNNLLTAILGHATLLAEEAAPKSAARAASIVSASEKAADLTRQLLAYAGKGQFYVKDLDVNGVVRELQELVRVSVPKGVEITFELADDLPQVRMDPSQLQQILINLVSNAGEAIGEGNRGMVWVGTGCAAVDEAITSDVGGEVAPGTYVWLEVADSGPGMEEETRAKIFDPFFTTRVTGRGLGLAAVSGIVRTQKGAITVDSAPGRGSRLRVYLPASGQRLPAVERKLGENVRGSILVMDEEPHVQEFLTAAVRRCGYRALPARDSAEARAICESQVESLGAVILDVVPAGGCREMLDEIRSRRPDMKVLLTSSYSEAEALALCGGCECAAFIRKPYGAQELTARLEAMLGCDPGGCRAAHNMVE